jgi:hypothetical protein
MNSFQVSAVANATDTATRNYDVTVIIEAIRTGGRKLRGKVQNIRATVQRELSQHGDAKRAKQAASELKKQLPAVLWTGTFTKRDNASLVNHSGLLCADLDSLNGDLYTVREKLWQSPHAYAVFISPSGDGLKAVFRVPDNATMHAGSFRAVEQHVRELTGIQIDQSCKDSARLCFLSYDPTVYHNANAREIEPLPEPEKPKAVNNGMVNLSERQRIATGLLGAVDWQSETSGFVTCPGKHLHTSGDNQRDCKIDFDGVPTVHCFHNSCHGLLEGVNHELRSRIGKAEYQPKQESETSELLGAGKAMPEPVLDPPVPYVSPPVWLLPSQLQDYTHAAAESLNVDVAYILLPLLSSLGSAIGNARSILLKRNFAQPPVIWTGIIGRSGSRKSPALDAGCFAVIEHERELVRQNNAAMEQFEQDLAEWESKNRKQRGVKPSLPVSLTCLMDNLTLEALADSMQANPRGVLVKKDELSHWFASFDQYTNAKGADVSQWLSLHTGAFFGLDRRSDHRRYRLHQPRVAVTGGIQPQVLKRVLTEDFFERGLPARFLFAHPPFQPDRWSETEIPEQLQSAVLELFQRLWLLQPGHDEHGHPYPKLLRLDADAKAQYVCFYDECGAASMQSDEREEAAWNKLSGYAARLALVGQIGRDPNAEVVTGKTMQAACDLARWFGHEAVRIYASLAETGEQREQRKLIEFIESRGGVVTVREVTHYCWSYKGRKEEAEQALSALVKTGRGRWQDIRPDGRGRPTRRFQLQASPSPKIPQIRGETANYGDGDEPSSRKDEAIGEPPPEPKPASAKPRGMTPGEFIAEAKRLFNATAATH